MVAALTSGAPLHVGAFAIRMQLGEPGTVNCRNIARSRLPPRLQHCAHYNALSCWVGSTAGACHEHRMP